MILLSIDEKGIFMFGLVNFLLVLFEVLFLYYVIRISNEYFMGIFDGVDINVEINFEVYSFFFCIIFVFYVDFVCIFFYFYCLWFKGVL